MAPSQLCLLKTGQVCGLKMFNDKIRMNGSMCLVYGKAYVV